MEELKARELFTDKLTAGSRTYFFDIKAAKDGTRYLVISESRLKDASREHTRVMVFEENLDAFNEGYAKARRFLALGKKPKSLDAIKRKYPKAYQPWTPSEDESLKAKHAEGVNAADLAVQFRRQPSAIRSRLRKLGAIS
jgi:hypothetical protein